MAPAALAAVVLVAGCAQTPMGPTAQVMPGRGKSFETFQADQAGCKTFASGQVQGQADAANRQAVGSVFVGTLLGAGLGAAAGDLGGSAGGGAAAGAAAGTLLGTGVGAGGASAAQAGIQQQYDMAFSQCMYAKGETVVGYQPPMAASEPAGGPVAQADPMVRSVQSELARLNYLHGSADGLMGPATGSAISRYQQANGMPVDGTPSPQLLARLQSTPSSTQAGSSQASSAPASTAPAAWVSPNSAARAAPAAAPASVGASSGWVSPASTQ